MSHATEFELRRRERLRRQRRRKKRIRAAIILIAIIGIVVIIAVATSMKNKNVIDSQTEQAEITETQEPEIATPEPVVSPISNIPPASEENDLMQIVNDSQQEKRCYLTFDDGPTTNITPQILDVLRRYNVKATFFQVGSLIDSNRDMARRVYEEGHLIANHSDSHNYEKLYASTESFINEINDCFAKIDEVTNGTQAMKLIRFPGGSYKSSADSYSPVKQECKVILKENGYYYCDWNSLTGDAEGKKKDAQGLLSYLKSTISPGKNIVVLMHDAAAKQTTADALPLVLDYLISEGYTFHRLDDINYNTVPETIDLENATVSDDNVSADGTQTNTQSTSDVSDTSVKNDTSNTSTETPAPTATPVVTQAPTPAPARSGQAIIIQ